MAKACYLLRVRASTAVLACLRYKLLSGLANSATLNR